MVDIRPAPDYNRGHLPGAVNVELYQLIDGGVAGSCRQGVGGLFFASTAVRCECPHSACGSGHLSGGLGKLVQDKL